MLIFLVILAISTASTYLFIPILRRNGFLSQDINKLNSKKDIPEPAGIPACIVYLIAIYLLSTDEQHRNALCLSLLASLFVGMIDDFYGYNWVMHIILPILCWIPSRYYATRPSFVRLRILKLIDLQFPLKGLSVLVWELAVICQFIFYPNSINIYAGLNTLELGQVFIISLFVHGFGFTECNETVKFYIYLFIPICLSLLIFNWYPAKVFLGNTFVVFSGIFLANLHLLGYDFVKLNLFFIPQIINFLLSIPQIFGFKPCPRHRTPAITSGGLLKDSGNLNLPNVTLKYFGPMHEMTLVCSLLLFQCLVGIYTHLIIS